jgi:hypothetical protein
MNQKVAELVERLSKPFTGPMTSEDLDFLKDVQAMIDFAVNNGLTFPMVVSALCSDMNELARDGFDLRKSRSRGFVPKSEGYSKLSSDDFGESDEPLS